MEAFNENSHNRGANGDRFDRSSRRENVIEKPQRSLPNYVSATDIKGIPSGPRATSQTE
jgi:hypothetical protein